MSQTIPETVTVDCLALAAVLHALVGAPHLIRELQCTRGLPFEPKNPIDLLIEQYNAQVEAAAKGA